MMTNKKIRVAVAGLGAIGKALSTKLAAGAVPGIELTAVSAKNHDKANEFVKTLAHPVKVLRIEDLEPEADIVVECAPAEFLGDIVTPFLKKQKKAIVLSVGAILFRQDLLDVAKQTGGVIMVPTGALIGLDAMLGAAEGKIHSVRMVTRKPPKGLEGAPHLIENNISVKGLTEPLKVFTITVDSDSAKFSMTMENIPSENPKTGRIVAQSVVAMLRKMTSHFQVGT